MNNFFKNTLNYFYLLIFREKVSEKAENFFKNIFYIAIGTVVFGLLSFIFNVLGGRMLGPVEYGRFSLIGSIAMLLYIPMLPGVSTAMVKYVAEKDDFVEKSKIISTTFILMLPLAVVFIFLYFIFASQLSKIFSISRSIFILSAIFAFLFAFYTMATETIRALGRMKILAFLKGVYGVILIVSFTLFILNKYFSFKILAFSTFIAFLIITGASLLFYIRKYLKYGFDKVWAKKLIVYSSWALVGAISYAIYSSFDKILINKYLTVDNVGIYEAYQFASINITVLIFSIFNTVFFPVASRHENKKNLVKKVNRLLPYLILIGAPFIFLCEFVILKLYGDRYQFNPLWALLLSIACVCICINGAYGWILASVGEKGVRIVSIASIFFALVNVILDIILVPLIGIPGAIISIILAFMTSTGINLVFGRKYYKGQELITRLD